MLCYFANSEKIFGCCNVFRLAKGLTITEIVLVILTLSFSFTGGSIDLRPLGILIHVAYLVTEYIGIHKKNKCLIIFGCVIRVLQQFFVLIFIALLFIPHVFFYNVCQELSQYGILGYESCETFM